jgi:hypothetical protein
LGETNNLAVKLPDKANALHTKLAAWRKEVGAPLPTKNPAPQPSGPKPKTAKKAKQAAASE